MYLGNITFVQTPQIMKDYMYHLYAFPGIRQQNVLIRFVLIKKGIITWASKLQRAIEYFCGVLMIVLNCACFVHREWLVVKSLLLIH